MRHWSSSGQNQTLRPGVLYGRHGDLDFSPSHRDFGHRIERGIGSDQLLNVERGVHGNETSKVKVEVAGESQVINRREKMGRRMAE
jgi:hypothetical protein